MKSLTVSIVAVLCFCFATAQTMDTIPDFKNEGERMDYSAKQLFEGNYLKQHYKKYKGRIIKPNNHTLTYGDKTLIVEEIPTVYKAIFESGIFYPGIITGDTPAIHKTDKEVEIMSPGQRAFYAFTRNDTLRIGSVDELQFLRTIKCRRFTFLLWRIGMMNPILYYIELTNDKATKVMPTNLFIKGAILTFFKQDSILI